MSSLFDVPHWHLAVQYGHALLDPCRSTESGLDALLPTYLATHESCNVCNAALPIYMQYYDRVALTLFSTGFRS